jgi:hypothetical protein
MALKLRYETGIATTIQFIAITALNFINGISGTINQCTTSNNSCVSDIITNLIFFILITIMFGALWLIGFAAQDRRSRLIAKILIAGELFLCLIGLFDIKHHNGSTIGDIISVVEIVSSIWISWLAFRLMQAKGGRVRSRKVRKHTKAQS